MDDETLSDILKDDDPTPAEPTTTEEAEAEKPAIHRDTETGRFAPKSPGETTEAAKPAVEEAAPPAAQQEAEPGHVPVAALKDERQKRQQLEEQVRQWEQWAYSQQQPQPQPVQQQQAPQPDPEVDFAGWLNWRDQQIAERVEQRVMQRVEQYGGHVETSNLVKVSQLLARQRHPDYDAVVSGPFMEACNANPMLVEQLRQAEDPAAFAYNAGNKWVEAKQYGNVAPPSREAIEAEIREKIMAEFGLSQSQRTAPSSLASERSVQGRSEPASYDMTLKELLA